MIKTTLTLLILGIFNAASAMENALDKKYNIQPVTLPSQKEIARRLNKLDLKDFVEKTRIDHILGDQIEHPFSTDCAVACALFAYEDAPSTKSLNIILAKQKKPEIIVAILQDHPNAIAYIKESSELSTKKMEELQITLRKKQQK
jgi:hypothetical protein